MFSCLTVFHLQSRYLSYALRFLGISNGEPFLSSEGKGLMEKFLAKSLSFQTVMHGSWQRRMHWLNVKD